jgi:erythromycin esterase
VQLKKSYGAWTGAQLNRRAFDIPANASRNPSRGIDRRTERQSDSGDELRPNTSNPEGMGFKMGKVFSTKAFQRQRWVLVAAVLSGVLPAAGRGQAPTAGALDSAAVRAEFRRAAASHPHTAWLQQNASTVRTLDPEDDDYSDFVGIQRAIGSARVVMLGEQTHGDGSSFMAKHRLIRFLHEKMGFEVLAFENPMYDSEHLWTRLVAGDSTFVRGIWGLYGRIDQVVPLWQYVRERAASDVPLRLVGIDPQSHLPISQDSLLIDLRWLLDRSGLDPQRLKEASPLATAVADLTRYRAPTMWLTDSLALLDREVRQHLAGAAADDRLHTMGRVLTGLVAFSKQVRLSTEASDSALSPAAKAALWDAGSGFRDEQMGYNLVWLARERFPDRKIIVWASSAHTSYGGIRADERDALSGTENSTGIRVAAVPLQYRPMGEVVRRALGDSVFSIMPTSYGGTAGTPVWSGQKSFPLEIHTSYNERPDLDFEDWMDAAGFTYAFVNLREPTPGGEWLRDSFVARPWGNVAHRAPYSTRTDAFLFIRTQHPATRGCRDYRVREFTGAVLTEAVCNP